MPLIKSKSKEAFDHNLKAEIHAGKPQKQSLAIAYSVKRKAKKMAHGGEVESAAPKPNDAANMEDADMIARIMAKRKQFAMGGMVADEGEADESDLADSKENDFDYLSSGDLNDSSSNSGAADGDSLGDEQEDEDRRDIVSKIMKQRKMKQSNPRPA